MVKTKKETAWSYEGALSEVELVPPRHWSLFQDCEESSRQTVC